MIPTITDCHQGDYLSLAASKNWPSDASPSDNLNPLLLVVNTVISVAPGGETYPYNDLVGIQGGISNKDSNAVYYFLHFLFHLLCLLLKIGEKERFEKIFALDDHYHHHKKSAQSHYFDDLVA